MLLQGSRQLHTFKQTNHLKECSAQLGTQRSAAAAAAAGEEQQDALAGEQRQKNSRMSACSCGGHVRAHPTAGRP